MKPASRFIQIFILLFSFLASVAAEDETPAPFAAGETITYDITKIGFKVGEAVLTYAGPRHVQCRDVILVTLVSKGPAFFDREAIYLDPATFLPLRVERAVRFPGKKETIVEYYDQARGRARIVKTARGTITERVIEKGRPIENIYGFIYRYRSSGEFHVGEKRGVHLPTRDVTFTLAGKEKFNAAGTVYEAYAMESMPAQYRVWFDVGAAKIPLRIDGAAGLGKTAMTLRLYTVSNTR